MSNTLHINVYKNYELLCNIFFKNTTICNDPFHVMKKVNDSLNTFRKRIMRTYQNEKEKDSKGNTDCLRVAIVLS